MRAEFTLGQRIKFARTNAKLSHDRLGEKVGTSRQHLIRLEKGLHKPRPEMAARIAEATGVPVELLQDDEEPPRGLPDHQMLVALHGALSQVLGLKATTQKEK